MYTRYTRGPDGIYHRVIEEEPRRTQHEPAITPCCEEAAPKDGTQTPPSVTAPAGTKKPGLLDRLLSRQIDADDLLLILIIVLLIMDGGDEDRFAMAAAILFLLL